ncbi:MAG: 2-amino-4-hydroxy-6-hydroxymethyldihydropteridine diphosphokinase, partial [Deltaproteobacteria bacterium]|nr:2-amino-4-hydroxy-6-hydroxymethyldihydropteridine diphosphokinase [Deltaproteobacteria bacterium]
MDGIICYIGIGSNLGDALDNCRKAVGLISRTEGISLERVSSFYKTEPVGIQSQDDFVNTVIEIKTTLGAVDLLKKLQDLENTMGRTRAVKGGPRTIDLDLLF